VIFTGDFKFLNDSLHHVSLTARCPYKSFDIKGLSKLGIEITNICSLFSVQLYWREERGKCIVRLHEVWCLMAFSFTTFFYIILIALFII
jgi:hypothetical protein